MNPGDYQSLANISGRVDVPWPFRDRLCYKAHVEPGLVRSLITEAPIEKVPLDALHAIQHTVGLERLVQYMLEPSLAEGRVHETIGTPTDLPIVVKFNGRLHIHDGHHRLTRAKLSGAATDDARVVDLDAAQSKKTSTKVQTLVFEKSKFSRAKAVAWAKTHDFKSNDVDETDTSFRLRQRDPNRFKPGSFRTVKLFAGVSAVIGKLK